MYNKKEWPWLLIWDSGDLGGQEVVAHSRSEEGIVRRFMDFVGYSATSENYLRIENNEHNL